MDRGVTSFELSFGGVVTTGDGSMMSFEEKGVTLRGRFVGYSADVLVAVDPAHEIEEVEATGVVAAESAHEVEVIANGLGVMETLPLLGVVATDVSEVVATAGSGLGLVCWLEVVHVECSMMSISLVE